MKSKLYPGLSVTIRVDGVDLKEYEHEHEDVGIIDNETSSTYVEAVPGKHFSIIVNTDESFRHRQSDLAIPVYLDGVRTRCGDIANATSYMHKPRKQYSGAHYNDERGEGFVQKFTFAELETCEGPASDEDTKAMSGIGEVRVELIRIRVAGPMEIKPCKAVFLRDKILPEKALKGRAVSNRTKLGEAQKCAAIATRAVSYPWGSTPFAKFIFRYRTRRDLQIQGLIPRTPSPVPLEDRDRDTLTREEMLEIIRRKDERLKQMIRIKKENEEKKRCRPKTPDHNEVNDDGLAVVREEDRASKRARLLSQMASGEVQVLDLSDD